MVISESSGLELVAVKSQYSCNSKFYKCLRKNYKENEELAIGLTSVNTTSHKPAARWSQDFWEDVAVLAGARIFE